MKAAAVGLPKKGKITNTVGQTKSNPNLKIFDNESTTQVFFKLIFADHSHFERYGEKKIPAEWITLKRQVHMSFEPLS